MAGLQSSITGEIIMSNGAPQQPNKHSWKPNWEWTQPLKPVQASLTAGKTVQRWFTAATGWWVRWGGMYYTKIMALSYTCTLLKKRTIKSGTQNPILMSNLAENRSNLKWADQTKLQSVLLPLSALHMIPTSPDPIFFYHCSIICQFGKTCFAQ